MPLSLEGRGKFLHTLKTLKNSPEAHVVWSAHIKEDRGVGGVLEWGTAAAVQHGWLFLHPVLPNPKSTPIGNIHR